MMNLCSNLRRCSPFIIKTFCERIWS